jgi:hypothetical protein
MMSSSTTTTTTTTTLTLLIDEFCTGTRDSAIDDITPLLLSSQIQFVDVVTSAGTYLTSENTEKRIGGIVLLCEVLRRCGTGLNLSHTTCVNLLTFFQSRLENDYDCALACLRGIELILTIHSITANLNNGTTLQETAKVVLGTHPVQSLAQPLRMVIFQIATYLVKFHPEQLTSAATNNDPKWFSTYFRNAMEGEKDPRCLLVCLECAGFILKNPLLGGEEWVEDIFDVVSMYFPVTFQPPPGDPYGITHDGLVNALNSVFQAHPRMADCVIPMILERLRMTSTEASEARVESLHALTANIPYFREQGLAPYVNDIRSILMGLILSPDDSELVVEATECLKTMVRVLAPSDAVVHVEDSPMWNLFVITAIKSCLEAFRTAIDSMAARGAGQIMIAIADAHGKGLSSVLAYTIPTLIGTEITTITTTTTDFIPPLSPSGLTTNNVNRRIVSLDILIKLLQCLHSDVAYVADANPIRPYILPLLQCFTAQLSFAHSVHFISDELSIGVLAMEGLHALLTRSKLPILDEQQSQFIYKMVKDIFLDALQEGSSNKTANIVLACIACLRSQPEIALYALEESVVVPKWTSKHLAATAALCTTTTLPSTVSLIITSILKQQLQFTMTNTVENQQYYLQTLCTLLSSLTPAQAVVVINQNIMPNQELFNFLFSSDCSTTTNDLQQIASELLFVIQTKADEESNFILTRKIEELLLLTTTTVTIGPREESVLLGSRRGACLTPLQTCLKLCSLQHNSGRALASIVNKLPDDDQFNHIVDQILLILSEKQDVEKLAWVQKALLMRSHDKSTQLGEMVVRQILSIDNNVNGDMMMAWSAANSLELLMRSHEYGLDKTSFARISPVYRQRVFETMFPILSNNNNATTGPRFMALANLIAGTPISVLMKFPDSEQLITIIVRCMTESTKLSIDHPFMVSFKLATLRALSLFIGDGKGVSSTSTSISTSTITTTTTLDLLIPHLSSIITFLLTCTLPPLPMESRITALESLQLLPVILPYHRVHMYKAQVSKHLSKGALDDDKKLVRTKAVECRVKWSVFNVV